MPYTLESDAVDFRDVATMTPEITVASIDEIYMNASTRPCRVTTGGGQTWVLKLVGAGPGPRGLLIELLALRFTAAIGAPVPEAKPLWLPQDFPWTIGTDEFDEMLQRSFGWNLGIGFVADARSMSVNKVLAEPPAVLAAIAAADRLAFNVDRTRDNPNVLAGSDGRAVAIDYDACLFLSRALAGRTPAAFDLPPGHLLEGLDLPEAEQAFDAALCETIAADVPAEWLPGGGHDARAAGRGAGGICGRVE